MEKGWYIGIDFGTTNTYIAAYYKADEDGKDLFYTNLTGWVKTTQRAQRGRRVTDRNNNIPTLATVNATLRTDGTLNKEILIGQMALDHPLLRIFPNLKNAARQLTPPDGLFGNSEQRPRQYPFGQCSQETKLQFGTEDNPVIAVVWDLLVEFFKKILHVKDGKFSPAINKESVQKITIGRPANARVDSDTAVEYEETLKNILLECFFGKRDCLEKEKFKEDRIKVEVEPILAGETYLYGDGLSGKKVLVIDIGGGTTDFSIIHYKKDEHGKSKPESVTSASCEIAGNAIDDFIFKLLPVDFPKSKRQCGFAKENLFGKQASMETIRPQGTLGKMRNGKILHLINEKGRDDCLNCIVLESGELYLDGEIVPKLNGDKAVGIEEVIYKPIGMKLCEMLEKWKSDEKRIDTIFFVGGTSVIKPLRDYLIGQVTTSGYVGTSVEVLSAEDGRKLSAPGTDELIAITNYNSVAIGACIKAMGVECAIKPQIKFEWNGSMESFDATKNIVVLKSDERFVPTEYVAINPTSLDVMCGSPTRFAQPIHWTVDGVDRRWRINQIDLRKAVDRAEEGSGALIVLSLSKNDAICTVYICKWAVADKKDGSKNSLLTEFINQFEWLADAIKQITTWSSTEQLLLNSEGE